MTSSTDPRVAILEGAGLDVAAFVRQSLGALLDAKVAAVQAAAARKEGDPATGRDLGDMSLAIALKLVRSLVAPEIDRVLLAGLLDVADDAAQALDRQRLAGELSRMNSTLSGGAADDLDRMAARRAVQRLLLLTEALTDHTFPSVAAGSIIAVNAGDVSRVGWIARPPKKPGKRRSGEQEVRMDRAYTAVLAAAYYSAGYTSGSVDAHLLQAAANLGVTDSMLKKYRAKHGLLTRCGEWRAEGAADAADGKPARSPTMSSAAAREMLGGRVRGSRRQVE